ncbi:MAG TPA: ABC transporter permease [Actinomycetota bacterium]
MSASGAGSRGVWRIIARREFVERGRDRGFAISTAITLLILVGIIVITSAVGGRTTYDLAVVGEGSRAVGEDVVAAAALLDIGVELHEVPDEQSARQALSDGAADAALVDAERIVVQSQPPAELVGLIQAASIRERSLAALTESGLTEAEVDEALNQQQLPVESVETVNARSRENATVAFVGVLALYGQLFAYGYWVAAGVVEEKASRVIEVLLATVRPSQLLRGKIFGIGLLGLGQLLLIGIVGLVTSMAVGRLEFPSGALATVGLVLFWFVLGFFFYATLFAVAGSIVTRQEDLQTTMTPLTLLIVASFFVGISATSNPSSTLATVASLLPFSSPLVMPTRIALGEATPWEVVLSIAISIGSTALLIPIATKVYSRALLQTGRVRIRQVLRQRG